MVNQLKVAILLLLLIFIVNYLLKQKEGFDTEMYRLGDMIHRSSGHNSRYSKETGFNYHIKHFPNSIATEYLLKTTKSRDYHTLLDIINKRQPKFYLDDTIVIHLRIGDVIDENKIKLDKLLSEYTTFSAGVNYVKPIKYYTNLIDTIHNYKIKKILLIGGFHRKGNHDKSLQYVNHIKQHFENNGFNCTTRINENADEDFLIMCNSKYFVPSGGGFSSIIKQMVILKGGTVIET